MAHLASAVFPSAQMRRIQFRTLNDRILGADLETGHNFRALQIRRPYLHLLAVTDKQNLIQFWQYKNLLASTNNSETNLNYLGFRHLAYAMINFPSYIHHFLTPTRYEFSS